MAKSDDDLIHKLLECIQATNSDYSTIVDNLGNIPDDTFEFICHSAERQIVIKEVRSAKVEAANAAMKALSQVSHNHTEKSQLKKMNKYKFKSGFSEGGSLYKKHFESERKMKKC